MWLRTDSVDIVNGNVSTWYDMSGNGNHANQTITDAQPNFIAPNDTNIYPAIMMDGENDYFQGDPISSINSSSYNFFIVHSGLFQDENIAAEYLASGQIQVCFYIDVFIRSKSHLLFHQQ